MLSTFHQQSLIWPNASHYLPTVQYQGHCVNDVIQILGANYMLPNREFRSKEYAGRSSQMIGAADDGTLILELYPLNDLLSEHDQTYVQWTPTTPNHLCGSWAHCCGTSSISLWCEQKKWVKAMSNPGFFQKDSSPVNQGGIFLLRFTILNLAMSSKLGWELPN